MTACLLARAIQNNALNTKKKIFVSARVSQPTQNKTTIFFYQWAISFFHLWSLRGIFNASLNIFRFSKRKRPEYFPTNGNDSKLHFFLSLFFALLKRYHSPFYCQFYCIWKRENISHFFAFYSRSLCAIWHAYAAFILLHPKCDTIFYQHPATTHTSRKKNHSTTEIYKLNMHDNIIIMKKNQHLHFSVAHWHVYLYTYILFFCIDLQCFKHWIPHWK